MTREEAIEIIKAKADYLESDKRFRAAVETLIPELAESEDERMMREFNDWLCEEIECLTNDLRDEEDRRTLNMLCYVLTKVKDWLEKQKEQKPAEYGVDVIKTSALLAADRLASAEMTGRLKERSEILNNPTKYGLQKPAEWSEEDERNIRNLESVLYYDKYLSDETRTELGNFLKSLPNRLNYQPKQEWSEEDELMRTAVIQTLKMFDGRGTTEMQIDWLKSLRPQPHWKPSEVCYGPTGDPDPAGTSDLEEAAEEYVSKTLCDPNDGPSTGLAKESFIAGAEWQKEQMMKGAVEAKIYGYDDGSFELIASWLDMPKESKFKDGDKVKIRIVKQ